MHLRPRTRREIENRLAQKGHNAEVIEDIIARLTSDYGLNDTEVARDYISHRQNRMGERRLRQELSKRGVSRVVVDAVMASDNPALRRDEEFDNALDLARRKVSQSEGVELRKIGMRIVGLLERRGYGPDIIRRVLETLELKLY
jgi:regulatory protein